MRSEFERAGVSGGQEGGHSLEQGGIGDGLLSGAVPFIKLRENGVCGFFVTKLKPSFGGENECAQVATANGRSAGVHCGDGLVEGDCGLGLACDSKGGGELEEIALGVATEPAVIEGLIEGEEVG